MRLIKKSEARKIIIGNVELTLLFLFDYLLCKIAILESLKVLFLDKKQKLLSVDGIAVVVCFLDNILLLMSLVPEATYKSRLRGGICCNKIEQNPPG